MKKLFKFCSSWIKFIRLEQIKNIIILRTNKNIRLNSYEHSQNIYQVEFQYYNSPIL